MASTRRSNEIDFLRFLAALAVVFFHYTYFGQMSRSTQFSYPLLAPFARYGLFGVQLFFMISGFVILMTACNTTVKKFVISRVVRLYPAFWICCTITFIARLCLGGEQFPTSIVTYLENMTMLGGFFGAKEIDGSYWTLVVEIRFYILIFLVLLFRQIHIIEKLLVYWLGVILVFDFMDFIGLDVPYTYQLRMFFLVGFGPYFIAGAIFFLIWSKGITKFRLFFLGLVWSLALYHVWRSLPEAERLFPSEYGIVGMSLVTIFFILMFLVSLERTGWIGNKNWMFVGALTYPLYLLHQVLGYIIFNMAYPTVNPHVLLYGTVGLMLGVAALIHFFIEEKYSRHFKKFLTNTF